MRAHPHRSPSRHCDPCSCRFWLYLIGIIIGILYIVITWPVENQIILNSIKKNDLITFTTLVNQELQSRMVIYVEQLAPIDQHRIDKQKSQTISPLRKPSINDITFGSGRGLMHAVAMHDRPQMLVWLLMRGADVDLVKDNDGRTPLHIAAAYAGEEVIDTLIKAGADVNAKTYLDWTPLLFAVLFSNTAGVRLLLEQHVDPNARVKEGLSALQMAIVYSTPEIQGMLVIAGAVIKRGEGYYPDYRSLLHLHHEAIRAAGHIIDDEYVYTQTPLDEL